MKKFLKLFIASILFIFALSTLYSCSDEPLYYEENEDGTYTVYADSDNCENIETIIIPDTHNGKAVTVVGEGAFKGCSSIKNVILGNNITKICNYAFEYDSIKSLTVPPSLKEIEPYAANNSTAAIDFSKFESIEEIHIEDINAWCKIDMGTCMFNNKTKLYLNDELVTDVIVSEEVTTIKNKTFAGYTYLKSITVGKNVTLIESGAFYNCTSLNKAYFEDAHSWKCGRYYISQEELAIPQTAASYLLGYYEGYWEKTK